MTPELLSARQRMTASHLVQVCEATMPSRIATRLGAIGGVRGGVPVLLILLAAGCGSSGEGVRSWCPAIPALSRDSSTDLTGKQNTLARVERVNARYSRVIVGHCHGVV